MLAGIACFCGFLLGVGIASFLFDHQVLMHGDRMEGIVKELKGHVGLFHHEMVVGVTDGVNYLVRIPEWNVPLYHAGDTCVICVYKERIVVSQA